MIGFDFKRHTDILGHHVSFTTKDVKDADKAFQSLIEGKPVEVIIRTKKIKRSLDANAYLWVLCDEIAKKIHTTKEEVYKHHVQDVGVFDFLAIPTKAVPQFVKSWNEKGLGWFVQIYNDYKIPKCTKLQRIGQDRRNSGGTRHNRRSYSRRDSGFIQKQAAGQDYRIYDDAVHGDAVVCICDVSADDILYQAEAAARMGCFHQEPPVAGRRFVGIPDGIYNTSYKNEHARRARSGLYLNGALQRRIDDESHI